MPAGQKKFNRLLKKIDTQRQMLETWQSVMSTCQTLWSTDFQPLMGLHREEDRVLVYFLDDASDRIKFSKKDRSTLQDIICELAESLTRNEDDEALKGIFNKHAEYDLETIRNQQTRCSGRR
jgi:hypothetical protein